MEKLLLDEIHECFDQKKWVLPFSKDCYATFLLDFWLKKNGPSHIRDIKKTQFSKLLERPEIKAIAASKAIIDSQTIADIWPTKVEPLVLTLGRWGGEKAYPGYQVSRKGYNLVLQVNLNEQWNRVLTKLFDSKPNEHMDCGHPINLSRGATLGWARLDIDFDNGELLIEEVQSDLVRRLSALKQYALLAQKDQCETFRFYYQQWQTKHVLTVLKQIDSMLINHWQEAILWSALWFSTNELGMDTIYYHTFETGALLKNIKRRQLPRSLYTDLPRKFCFSQTNEVPQLLQQTKSAMRRIKAQKNAAFFKLVA